jgi:hypothetical protein
LDGWKIILVAGIFNPWHFTRFANLFSSAPTPKKQAGFTVIKMGFKSNPAKNPASTFAEN